MSAALVGRDRLQGGCPVEVGFTDVRLDLGDRAADDVRAAGLQAVGHETGSRPQLMRQVHGAQVSRVGGAHPTRGWVDGEPPEADALVSSEAGVALLTRAADCVPVLLADAAAGVIGAVHAGRPGVVVGVVSAAIAQMRELGAADLTAWIGPHVCGSCYEVPEELRAEVVAVVPETWAVTSWGTPSLDLGAGVRAQLEAAGCAVRVVPGCTREDARWPSYRRDGVGAGRFAGVVWRPR